MHATNNARPDKSINDLILRLIKGFFIIALLSAFFIGHNVIGQSGFVLIYGFMGAIIATLTVIYLKTTRPIFFDEKGRAAVGYVGLYMGSTLFCISLAFVVNELYASPKDAKVITRKIIDKTTTHRRAQVSYFLVLDFERTDENVVVNEVVFKNAKIGEFAKVRIEHGALGYDIIEEIQLLK